jgi:hypothetical protein
MAQREQYFITEARLANKAIWEGIATLQRLQREADALDYGNTLDDGAGDNASILAADVLAVVYSTKDALLVPLAAGHATNMAKIL